MADIIWPVDLPQVPLIDGHQETRTRNTLRSPVDQGRPKSRRRYTGKIQAFQVAIIVTAAQSQIFWDFYDDTSAEGSLAFDWAHPRTQIAAECQFAGDDAPVQTPTEGLYRIAFQMIILP
jgi:hypothetical protein